MKTLLLIVVVALAATISSAQLRDGKNRELSLSGSYQNYSSERSSGSSSAILISPRVGFFIVEGLELEPEVLLMLTSGSDPVYVINANVAYNFISSKKNVPFLLLGYGRANTIPFFNVPHRRVDFGVGVVNVGAGLKIFLSDDVALRLEYRFQSFSGEGEPTTYGSYSFTEEVDTRIHTVQFGLSVLL